MLKKSILTVLISFSFIFILAGCQQTSEQKDSGDTITISHAMGQTNVPKEPKRVVILTNEGTEALLALGVKPVGAVNSWVGDPWYSHISEQMEGVTNVGFETAVNLEEVLKLNPDLIIGNKLRQEDIYDDLSLIAPTVFSETLKGEWQANFTFYAKALGMESEGQALLNDFQDKVSQIKQSAEDKGLLEKEIAVLRFMAGTTRLYLEDSFSGVLLNSVGFNRTTSDTADNNFAVEITQEQLLDIANTSDIIIYFTYESGNGDATNNEADWLDSDVFKSLPAYNNNQTYEVNDAIWNTSGGILAANQAADDLLDFVNNHF